MTQTSGQLPLLLGMYGWLHRRFLLRSPSSRVLFSFFSESLLESYGHIVRYGGWSCMESYLKLFRYGSDS